MFHSRSKLKFARGTPSDSLAFVNAFKVTFNAKVNRVFFLRDARMDAVFNTIVFCLRPSGVDHSQKERSAETPQGEPIHGKTKLFTTFYRGCFLFALDVFSCFTFIPPPQDELDWGKESFIQIKRIREVPNQFLHSFSLIFLENNVNAEPAV